jgi:hypothetical protein
MAHLKRSSIKQVLAYGSWSQCCLFILCGLIFACSDDSASNSSGPKGDVGDASTPENGTILNGDLLHLPPSDGSYAVHDSATADAVGLDMTHRSDGSTNDGDEGTRGDSIAPDASLTAHLDSTLNREHQDVGIMPDTLAPPWNQRFDDVVFGATHNSYSGNERRTVVDQLNRGIRMLEFDFHVAGFREADWRLGHGRPGSEVDEGGGNPDSDRLTPWLQMVADWSRAHPDHAPITIALDSKSTLSQTQGPDEGNLGALNERLVTVFGRRLFWSRDLGPRWPRLDELRGKVLAVLTGNVEDRQAYQRDQGIEATVSVNAVGKIIEIHASENRELWYWTGEVDPIDGVIWWHHGRYDTGLQPAVILTDNGYIIDLHKTHRDDDRLWATVGILGADHTVRWNDAHEVGPGEQPTLALLADGRVQAVYSHDGRRKTMFGQLNAERTRMLWTEPENTNQAPFDNQRSGSLEVLIQADRFAPETTLQYRFDGGEIRRLTYAQVMHSEFQLGDTSAELEDSARFFALQADRTSANAAAALSNRGPVRVWSYNESRRNDRPVPAFPATDFPFSAWYDDLMNVANAVDWTPR